jgi:hypothetical protein
MRRWHALTRVGDVEPSLESHALALAQRALAVVRVLVHEAVGCARAARDGGKRKQRASARVCVCGARRPPSGRATGAGTRTRAPASDGQPQHAPRRDGNKARTCAAAHPLGHAVLEHRQVGVDAEVAEAVGRDVKEVKVNWCVCVCDGAFCHYSVGSRRNIGKVVGHTKRRGRSFECKNMSMRARTQRGRHGTHPATCRWPRAPSGGTGSRCLMAVVVTCACARPHVARVCVCVCVCVCA